MKLKGSLKKDAFEALKAEEKPFYELLEGTEIYVLKEGETEDVHGLKTALEDKKQKNLRLEEGMKTFEGVDADKYKKFVQEEQEFQRRKLEVDTQIAANNTQWETKLENKTKKLQTRNEVLQEALTKALIDRSLLAAAGDKILSPTIWLRSAKDHVRLLEVKGENDRPEFTVEVIDPDKRVARISQKSNGPMTLEELVEDLGTKDEFKPLYRAPNAAGSGAGGQQQRPAGGGGAAPVLTREQALDPRQYRAAKDAAAKAGQGLPVIEPPPSLANSGT